MKRHNTSVGGILWKSGICLAALALVVSLFWACTSGPVVSKPRIAVSVQPQKYMLEQIAGKHCDVICLLPEGVATTGFDASITHLMNISGCSAYMMIGNIPLEHAIMGKVKNTYPALKLYDCSEGLSVIVSASDSLPDQYTWNSVKNAKVISYNMYKALAEIDPTNEGYYRRRMSRFLHRLDELDRELRATLSASDRRLFIPAKPELSYFARDYGLLQVTDENSVPDSAAVARVDVNLYGYQWPDAMRRVAQSIVGK